MRTLSDIYFEYELHPEFLGIDIRDPNQRGALDSALLHIVARSGKIEDIEILVENGADINVKGDLGYSPLHDAVMANRSKAVEVLLRFGADKDQRDEEGRTPGDLAKAQGLRKIENILSQRVR